MSKVKNEQPSIAVRNVVHSSVVLSRAMIEDAIRKHLESIIAVQEEKPDSFEQSELIQPLNNPVYFNFHIGENDGGDPDVSGVEVTYQTPI